MCLGWSGKDTVDEVRALVPFDGDVRTEGKQGVPAQGRGHAHDLAGIGVFCCEDAGFCILKDDAAGRVGMKQFRSLEVKVRRRLSGKRAVAVDHFVKVEPAVQMQMFKEETHVAQRGCRCDGVGDAAGFHLPLAKGGYKPRKSVTPSSR